MKFTKDVVATLTMPPGKTDHIVWDAGMPGFGCRLRDDRKNWVVQYRTKTGSQRGHERGSDRQQSGYQYQ